MIREACRLASKLCEAMRVTQGRKDGLRTPRMPGACIRRPLKQGETRGFGELVLIPACQVDMVIARRGWKASYIPSRPSLNLLCDGHTFHQQTAQTMTTVLICSDRIARLVQHPFHLHPYHLLPQSCSRQIICLVHFCSSSLLKLRHRSPRSIA